MAWEMMKMIAVLSGNKFLKMVSSFELKWFQIVKKNYILYKDVNLYGEP